MAQDTLTKERAQNSAHSTIWLNVKKPIFARLPDKVALLNRIQLTDYLIPIDGLGSTVTVRCC